VVEPQSDRVGLGNTVKIKDDAGQAKTYQVVSKHSARPSEGLISDESPLGRAILDHQPGETVEYATPNGQKKSVTILSME
jgi:transcription elongation factor GreA